MPKKRLLGLAFLGLTAVLQAQPNPQKLYEGRAYGAYIDWFSRQSFSPEGENLVQLAESYRKLGNTEASEGLYRVLATQQPDKPDYVLYYAQALQGNGKYAQAKVEYLKYDALMREKGKDDPRGQIMAAACDRIQNLKATGKVEIHNEYKVNESRLDFAPSYYKEGIVFVSSRGPKSKRTDRWINDNFMDWYYAEREAASGHLAKPKLFASEISSKFHEGPLSFNANGQKMYFTRNNYLHGKQVKGQDGVMRLSIYSARHLGRWIDVKPFEYNEKDYDVCHPTLSPDGQVLIFASDKPGGYGGLDLYYCRWQGNRWAAPVNLGAMVNTPGNEAFPFLHANGTLFFASDGWGGLGRIDIYMSSPDLSKSDSLAWSAAFNLGAPFNSQYDDFGFIIDLDEQTGYFTSNRLGGKGMDDIYSFRIEGKLPGIAPAPLVQALLCAYDQATGQRLEGVSLSLTEGEATALAVSEPGQNGELLLRLRPTSPGSADYYLSLGETPGAGAKTAKDQGQNQPLLTDAQGSVRQPLRLGKTYTLEGEKNGYKPARESLKFMSADQQAEFCLSMERLAAPSKAKPNEPDPERMERLRRQYAPEPFLAGMVYNTAYERPLGGASVSLFNRCTGEEQNLNVAADGRFEAVLECGCDYVVRANKVHFLPTQKVISLSEPQACRGHELWLGLSPELDKEGKKTKRPQGSGDKTQDLAQGNYGSLQEGDIIELRQIFYDYNKADIRQDAQRDLVSVVELLRAFPLMEIELASHTDSRGTAEANMRLSERRAQAAKEWVVQEGGIDPRRIRAKGYGETRLRNGCDDNRVCEEVEHAINRRTEVFILKFEQDEDSPKVKVIFKENRPE